MFPVFNAHEAKNNRFQVNKSRYKQCEVALNFWTGQNILKKIIENY